MISHWSVLVEFREGDAEVKCVLFLLLAICIGETILDVRFHRGWQESSLTKVNFARKYFKETFSIKQDNIMA